MRKILRMAVQPNEVADLVAHHSILAEFTLTWIDGDSCTRTIPKPLDDAKVLFEQVKAQHTKPEDWDTLSMGMSGDMQDAIAAGSTMVRVGTALFGARDYSKNRTEVQPAFQKLRLIKCKHSRVNFSNR